MPELEVLDFEPVGDEYIDVDFWPDDDYDRDLEYADEYDTEGNYMPMRPIRGANILGDGHRHSYKALYEGKAIYCRHCACTREEARQYAANRRIPFTYWSDRIKEDVPEVEQMAMIKAVAKYFREKVDRGGGGGLNDFAWVYRNATLERFEGQPCYAVLEYVECPGDSAVAWIDISGFNEFAYEDLDTPEIRAWAEHIMQDSPFSPAFLVKDFKTWAKTTGIFDVTVPGRLVIQAAMCMRYVYEFPNVVSNWNALVRHGMNKDLAIIMAHFLTDNGRGFVKSVGLNGGHTWMDTQFFGSKQMSNFMNRVYNPIAPAMRDRSAFYPSSKVWHPDSVDDENLEIMRIMPFLRDREYDLVWGGKFVVEQIEYFEVPMIETKLREGGYINGPGG
jgi:hypothetical protein